MKDETSTRSTTLSTTTGSKATGARATAPKAAAGKPAAEPTSKAMEVGTDISAGLTERQRKVLEVIRASVTERGYPPSIREIGDAVGLTSTSSVAHQLRTLERKGFLRRDANRPRAVDVRGLDEVQADQAAAAVDGSQASEEQDRLPTPDVRAGTGPDRCRRSDSGRGSRRGRLPAPPRAGRTGFAVPAQGGR